MADTTIAPTATPSDPDSETDDAAIDRVDDRAPWTLRLYGAAGGLIAAFAALATAELVAGTRNDLQSPVLDVGDRVVDAVPRPVKDLLTSTLAYHVVAGDSLSSADLIAAGTVETVNGGSLTVTDEGGTLTVNGIPTVCMDVPTANATVHIIGGVLMPA